jgi:hypothetical protein
LRGAAGISRRCSGRCSSASPVPGAIAYLLNLARADAGGREPNGMPARMGLPHYVATAIAARPSTASPMTSAPVIHKDHVGVRGGVYVVSGRGTERKPRAKWAMARWLRSAGRRTLCSA